MLTDFIKLIKTDDGKYMLYSSELVTEYYCKKVYCKNNPDFFADKKLN